MAQVVFVKTDKDEHEHVRHWFDAHLEGMEYSTITFAISDDGKIMNRSKYFQSLTQFTQEKLAKLACEELPR